jgi:hypothetical protein
MDSKESTILIFGYTPLMQTQFMSTKSSGVNIGKAIEKWHSFSVPETYGCVWVSYKNKISPVFLIDRAKEVYDHLISWTENSPQDWFTFSLREFEDGYAICLMPNASKSIKRFKQNHELMYDEEIKIEKAHVLFRTISVFCLSKATLQHIRCPKVGEKTNVGFITPEDFQNNKLDIPFIEVDVVVDNGHLRDVINEYRNN